MTFTLQSTLMEKCLALPPGTSRHGAALWVVHAGCHFALHVSPPHVHRRPPPLRVPLPQGMGARLAKLSPTRGFCAELSTAIVIMVASQVSWQRELVDLFRERASWVFD